MKKTRKKIIAFSLALVLSFALAAPALAAGTPLLPEKSGSTTLTIEIPEISYTLTVPSSCSIAFAGENQYRSIGSVIVTKAERFTEANYVELTVSHDTFSSETSEKALGYNVEVCGTAKVGGQECYVDLDYAVYKKDPLNNWIRFYPEVDSVPSGSASIEFVNGSVPCTYIRSQDTVPLRIKLFDMSTLDAGTYTSTITFTANLY